MPPLDPDLEKRACEAADTYRCGEIKNVAQLQWQFNVPYHLIQSQLNGCKTRKAPQPGNKILDASQENAVKLWIKQLDEAG